mmetsp:Transcript_6814/g.17650  ORF Transcript_6814/g.17650 Transcript_6814/m.17650 type:complete len:246 (-) Transcript_6814:62-799(-)
MLPARANHRLQHQQSGAYMLVQGLQSGAQSADSAVDLTNLRDQEMQHTLLLLPMVLIRQVPQPCIGFQLPPHCPVDLFLDGLDGGQVLLVKELQQLVIAGWSKHAAIGAQQDGHLHVASLQRILHWCFVPAVDWVDLAVALLHEEGNGEQHAVRGRDVDGSAQVVVIDIGADAVLDQQLGFGDVAFADNRHEVHCRMALIRSDFLAKLSAVEAQQVRHQLMSAQDRIFQWCPAIRILGVDGSPLC